MKLYHQYINQIINNEIIHGQMVRLGVLRHLNDLEKSETDDFPYYFSEEKADEFIKFVGLCKLTSKEWQGKPFPIQPFQAFYYAMVYGWLHKETHFRRFKKVYWCTARKSAKSEMTAPELIHPLIMYPGECQNTIIATKFDQTKYVFNPCVYMMKELQKDFEELSFIKKKQYSINNLDNGSTITRWAADADKEDGAGILILCTDEYHAHDNDRLLGVAESSQGSYDEPLSKIVTTAGFNKNGPDYALRQKCYNILKGIINDDELFTMIYELDPGDDYHDEKTWYKSNPMMGTTPKLSFMRTEYKNAVNDGGEKLVNFLTKNLNMYTDASSVWIETEKYRKCANFIPHDELIGKKCVMGFDLASEHDTTAATVLFPPQPGLSKFYYFTMYFCPASKFKRVRVDGVFYEDWYPDWIDKTDGDVIDKERIKIKVLQWAEQFQVVNMGFDAHKAVDLMIDLEKEGLPCGKVGQSAAILGMGNSLWKELILRGPEFIIHDGSPVTTWQMGNIEMYTDGNGNQKIVKGQGKTENKVDGPVSCSNAFVAYLDWKKMEEEEKELHTEDFGFI